MLACNLSTACGANLFVCYALYMGLAYPHVFQTGSFPSRFWAGLGWLWMHSTAAGLLFSRAGTTNCLLLRSLPLGRFGLASDGCKVLLLAGNLGKAAAVAAADAHVYL